MSDPGGRKETGPEVAGLIEVERLCDEFEAMWRAGKRPRIEDFLARGPQSQRQRLLGALLEIELAGRDQGNESFSLEQYRRRFADDRGADRDGFPPRREVRPAGRL